jgi:hypothetical protein
LKLNDSSEHTDGVEGTPNGSGFTVTVIVNGVPGQLLGVAEVGVTVYTIVAAVLLTLLMLPVTFPVPVCPVVTPVTAPEIEVTTQVNVLATEFPPVLMLS